MPGVAKEDVKVAIDGRRISVEAQSARTRKEGRRPRRLPRAIAGQLCAQLQLATDIDQAESSAKLENGVLTLSLVKRGTPAATRITVN